MSLFAPFRPAGEPEQAEARSAATIEALQAEVECAAAPARGGAPRRASKPVADLAPWLVQGGRASRLTSFRLRPPAPARPWWMPLGTRPVRGYSRSIARVWIGFPLSVLITALLCALWWSKPSPQALPYVRLYMGQKRRWANDDSHDRVRRARLRMWAANSRQRANARRPACRRAHPRAARDDGSVAAATRADDRRHLPAGAQV